ncbi:GDP-mannose 4,6-dehydratase [Paenibacillus sedimenti]|uniref:GDP-mannose 4,6-dehydratase n=1 Tax=Paenibacillus sedimenti TaxID=2770274 RepID=A0A926KST7_9BACL|nr:GDP-mannose 4,6-dehydratase [Paenibacillus sedimenti]MBD0381593.1 GDP-mannose 4,6-dehydratase [Paenibacillus sedimenti]
MMSAPPTVLLTGINGFIGQHMAAYLLDRNMNVLGIGRSADCLVQHPRLTYASCDVLNPSAIKQLLQNESVTHIIHLAGANDVSTSFADPVQCLQANSWGTLNVLEAVRTAQTKNLKGFLAVGTAYEYALQTGPLTESSPLLPISPYAWSKHVMTSLMQMYGLVYSIPTLVARTFNLIGPGHGAGVCAQLTRRVALMEKGLLPPNLIVGNTKVERDFLDVRDAVAAYFSLLELAPAAPGSIFNVCSGTAYPISTIISLLIRHAAVPFEVSVDDSLIRTNEASVVQGDNSKLIAASAWKPSIPLEQSIVDTLNYYRNLE